MNNAPLPAGMGKSYYLCSSKNKRKGGLSIRGFDSIFPQAPVLRGWAAGGELGIGDLLLSKTGKRMPVIVYRGARKGEENTGISSSTM